MGSSKKRKKRKLNRFDRVILKYIPKLFEILGWVAIRINKINKIK